MKWSFCFLFVGFFYIRYLQGGMTGVLQYSLLLFFSFLRFSFTNKVLSTNIHRVLHKIY